MIITKNIWDHCHYNGKHRSAAHMCNLRYGIQKNIPVVFYNGLNYDHHFKSEESKG